MWPEIATHLVGEYPELADEFFRQVMTIAESLLSLQKKGLQVSRELPLFYDTPPISRTHFTRKPVKVDLERIVLNAHTALPEVSSEEAAAMSPEVAAAATIALALGRNIEPGKDLVTMLKPHGGDVLRVRQDLESIEACLATRQPIIANIMIPGVCERSAFLVVGFIDRTREFTLINISTKVRVPFSTLLDRILTAELYVVVM